MRRTVLIVEDSPQYASSLEIALSQMVETDVRCALTGRDALRILEGPGGDSVCAVVTDLQMPMMDGFELIEYLRSHDSWLWLPIVVVSGAVDPASRERCYRLGANAFFSKPYSPSAVRMKIEELVQARETGGQNE